MIFAGPVIALSGPPGAGKSTFGGKIAQWLQAERLDYDNYERITSRPAAEIADWLSRGAPIAEIPVPGLAEAVLSARARGPVVLETPLGRAHPALTGLIDVAIWLDTPLDLALSRKMQRMLAHLDAPNQAPGAATGWIRAHLSDYEGIIRPSLLVQAERVRPGCDRHGPNDGPAERTEAALRREIQARVRSGSALP